MKNTVGSALLLGNKSHQMPQMAADVVTLAPQHIKRAWKVWTIQTAKSLPYFIYVQSSFYLRCCPGQLYLWAIDEVKMSNWECISLVTFNLKTNCSSTFSCSMGKSWKYNSIVFTYMKVKKDQISTESALDWGVWQLSRRISLGLYFPLPAPGPTPDPEKNHKSN